METNIIPIHTTDDLKVEGMTTEEMEQEIRKLAQKVKEVVLPLCPSSQALDNKK